jgi:hypothetical protein
MSAPIAIEALVKRFPWSSIFSPWMMPLAGAIPGTADNAADNIRVALKGATKYLVMLMKRVITIARFELSVAICVKLDRTVGFEAADLVAEDGGARARLYRSCKVVDSSRRKRCRRRVDQQKLPADRRGDRIVACTGTIGENNSLHRCYQLDEVTCRDWRHAQSSAHT